jgi:hypothetical protein
LFGCDRVGKYVPRDPFDATATMLCTYCMYTCIRTPEKNIFLLVGEEMKKAFLCFEKSANWRRKKLRKRSAFSMCQSIHCWTLPKKARLIENREEKNR